MAPIALNSARKTAIHRARKDNGSPQANVSLLATNLPSTCRVALAVVSWQQNSHALVVCDLVTNKSVEKCMGVCGLTIACHGLFSPVVYRHTVCMATASAAPIDVAGLWAEFKRFVCICNQHCWKSQAAY